MNVNIDLKDLPALIAPITKFFKRYVVLIFILSFLGLYGFLVMRINSLSLAEPDEAAVAEKLNTLQRPQIDKSTVDKIKELQGQNVQVQTLFQQARENPFSE